MLAAYRLRSQTRILTNTVSLLFFAVPHRGGFFSSPWIKFTVYLMSFTRMFKTRNLDILPSKQEYRAMLEAFAPISGRFRIYTFCYALTTLEFFTTFEQDLGDVMNSYMGLPNEELLHINATYANMIKFSCADDADYGKVVAVLQHAPSQDGSTPRSNNWRADQLFRLDNLER